MFTTQPDLVCLSHLRWNFVYQRPQHLMSRFAREWRVFFVEEPVWEEAHQVPFLEVERPLASLIRVVPHLPQGLPLEMAEPVQQRLLAELFVEYSIDEPLLWFYTPMALGWLPEIEPHTVIYDVMDELSLFLAPPPELLEREAQLFEWADLVFTGGPGLYESKRSRHTNVHCFPSSIDRAHFAQARTGLAEPADQRLILTPRLGFFGVIDERMDLALLAGVAGARPDWQLVMVGPIVKIDPAALPQAPNLHYLGMKPYDELPAYLAGWDVALMPFARNDATRFISPTKTPEYLAGGVPVVSTAIRDVERLYGHSGLIQIADTVPEFIEAVERAMLQRNDSRWLEQVDKLLSHSSWDTTWASMERQLQPFLRGFPQGDPIF